MHRALSVGITLLLLSVAPACGFYFGDDDPCDDIDYGGGNTAVPEPVAETGLINPISGQCEFFGDPNPPTFPCDSECGAPCIGDAEQPGVPQPSWGFCDSFCTGLDEATCLATAGCRGGYIDGGDGADIFDQCWMTDTLGPIQGECNGLDAYSCSQHDDCIAIHANACADPNTDPALVPACMGAFQSCANEDGSTDPGNCYDEVLCDGPTPECPPDTLPGIKDGCYTGFCIPIDQCEGQLTCDQIVEETACIGRADCTPLYLGDNCTCDPNGCVCTNLTYDSCEAAAP